MVSVVVNPVPLWRQLQGWVRYQRRLPALAAVMGSMRDFYMELHWAFESPVVPFISRLAPSDTYRIWKRGPNLRADITLAGFDGFRSAWASMASCQPVPYGLSSGPIRWHAPATAP